MGTTALRRRTARLLALLAVVLGLLAMHGLASTHHAAAAAQHAPAPAAFPADAPAAAEHHDGRGQTHATAAQPVALPRDAALPAPGGAPCAGNCQDLAVLCVAVPVVAALALMLAHRPQALLPHTPTRPRAPTRAPPVRLARGPDPVKELCVSRT